ncbi:hypothetical protein AB205_0044470, partial [Aquarana catesbeiana]
MASPISAVQAGEVASTTSVLQPPRRQRQACRAHSALSAAFANPNWEPTTSAAPVPPPFTGQLRIQVETVDFMSLDFFCCFSRNISIDLLLGERACLRCNNLLTVKWRDNKNVFVLSSLHADTTVQIQTVTGVVEKPLCIHEYNLNMEGVDHNSQLLALFLIACKARRWYKKVSVYLFQLALVNAYVLYQAVGRTGSFLKFQEEIITALLFPDGAVAQLPNPNAVSRLHEKHFMLLFYVLPGTPTHKNPQRRCRVCRKCGNRLDTAFIVSPLATNLVFAL